VHAAAIFPLKPLGLGGRDTYYSHLCVYLASVSHSSNLASCQQPCHCCIAALLHCAVPCVGTGAAHYSSSASLRAQGCSSQQRRLVVSIGVLVAAAASRKRDATLSWLTALALPRARISGFCGTNVVGHRYNHNRGGCSGNIGVQHSAFEKPLSFC